jgi:hypothetical protein
MRTGMADSTVGLPRAWGSENLPPIRADCIPVREAWRLSPEMVP